MILNENADIYLIHRKAIRIHVFKILDSEFELEFEFVL